MNPWSLSLRIAGWLCSLAVLPASAAQQPSAPTIEIVTPAPGTAFVLGQSIEIAARLSGDDPAGWSDVVFLANDRELGTVRPQPDAAGALLKVVYVWKGPPIGAYALRVRGQHRQLELPVLSPPVEIKVAAGTDNQRPTVQILEPKANASYEAGVPVPIRIAAVDPDGYVPHAEFYVDGQQIGEQTLHFFVAPPPGQTQEFEWTWADPSPGSHRVAVLVADDRNGKAEAGVAVQVGITRLPVVSIEATRPATAEPCPTCRVAPGQFTLTRTLSLDSALVVQLHYSGSATPGTDYAELPREIEFPAGQATVELTVAALDDTLAEGDETVIASLALPSTGTPPKYAINPNHARAEVVIHDDELPDGIPVVSIEATQPRTSEPCPTCRVVPGVFTLTRTGSTADPLSVMLSYGGTATPGDDYEKLPMFAEFPAGQATLDLNVLARLDQLVEGDEIVIAQVEADPTDGAVPHYRVDPNQSAAKVLIQDTPEADRVPVVSITASRPETGECPPGADCDLAPAEFLLQRSAPSLAEPLTVWIRWGGTADWPADYAVLHHPALPNTITFEANSDTARLQVEGITDCVLEETEIVTVELLPDPSLGPIERYRIAAGYGAARVAIADGTKPIGDGTPVVSIRARPSTPEQCPQDASCAGIRFEVFRQGGDLSQPLEVPIAFAGTATAGVDYPALPPSVQFKPGQMSAVLSTLPIDDQLVEGNETIIATLLCSDTAIPGYVIDGAYASATTTVIDDDGPVGEPFVRIVAPEDGAVFANPEAITFQARTRDPLGTFTHLDWYAGEAKIGESDIVFIVPPKPGLELTHEFTWTQPPVGIHKVFATGLAANGQRVVSPPIRITVTTADKLPVVTVEAGLAETREVPPGSRMPLIPATFILHRTGDLTHPLRVDYTLSGTARNGRDYAFLDGDATFVAGAAERVVDVVPITDELLEGDEWVQLTLTPRDAYTVGSPNAARIVIHDAQSAAEPRVVYLEPEDGAHFDTGTDIRLRVTTVNPAGYFGTVEFFANGQSLGSDVLVLCEALGCEPAPGTPIAFTLLWKSVPAGEYTLSAVAGSPDGLAAKADPIRIVVSPLSPPSFATRDLPDAYEPGVPFTVTLQATPSADTASYALADQPPAGWTVSHISEGGAWDAIHGTVKFGPFLDALPRTLAYTVTPPADASGVAGFDGLASVDGRSSRIGGDQRVASSARPHPADRNPLDWALSADEVTAYGAAWRLGAAWPTAPNPIPLDYVTRAGALWRGGENYRLDPSAGPAPLGWVNRSTDGVQPGGLDFDLPASDLAAQIKQLRDHQSFALAEVVPDDTGNASIRIHVLPGPNVRAQAVEGVLPAEVKVTDITEGGVLDPAGRIIRWGPFADAQPRVLAARVAEGRFAAVSGRASFDGESLAFAARTAAGETGTPGARGPRIAEVRPLPDGTMQLVVVDDTTKGCSLEYSEDLVTWHRIGEIATGTECQIHHDSDANESPRRFYRAVRQQ